MDKIFLRLIKSLNPILSRSGVNTAQLHDILRIKLLMDNRRPRTLFAKRRANTNTSVSNPWMVTFFALLMGFFIGLALFFFKMPLAAHTVYFSVFIILMCFTLVTDFTSVLIDTRDQFILLPRPVDDRTIAVSRILHITIYVLRLALIQGLPGIIMAGIADMNVFSSVVMLVEILEATFISILFVNLIYLAMMRTVSPQKFKDIISYFQIAFSILIFAVYYLLPRLINFKVLVKVDIMQYWWVNLLPSTWISALNQAVIHPSQVNFTVIGLALVGLLLPLAGLWFVIKVLAPGFNRKLMVLATSDGNDTTTSSTKKIYKQDFRDKVANFVAPDPVENAGFRITWKMAARTREFKMKTYPSFAFVPIMFLYFTLINAHGTLPEKMAKVQNGQNYIFLIYLSTIVLSSMLMMVSQSEKYKSAWVYYALPIDKPGRVLAGMFKAIVTLYYLPFCLLLGIGMVAVWGPRVINDVILAFLINLIYGILIALFAVKGFPFSKPILNKQAGGKAISNLVTMALVGVLGLGHYYLLKWEIAIWISIIPVGAIAWLMLHNYSKQTWEDMEAFEVDEIEKKPVKKPLKVA
jgi:ABC-2 type transport system permease protein